MRRRGNCLRHIKNICLWIDNPVLQSGVERERIVDDNTDDKQKIYNGIHVDTLSQGID